MKPAGSKISSPKVTISKPQRLCLSIIYFSSGSAQVHVTSNGDKIKDEKLDVSTVIKH
jgi:hypothetical protein